MNNQNIEFIKYLIKQRNRLTASIINWKDLFYKCNKSYMIEEHIKGLEETVARYDKLIDDMLA